MSRFFPEPQTSREPSVMITTLYFLRISGCRFSYEIGENTIEITSQTNPDEKSSDAIQIIINILNKKLFSLSCHTTVQERLIPEKGMSQVMTITAKKDRCIENIGKMLTDEIKLMCHGTDAKFQFKELGTIENPQQPIVAPNSQSNVLR